MTTVSSSVGSLRHIAGIHRKSSVLRRVSPVYTITTIFDANVYHVPGF